jgi:heptosyltransferase-3
VKPESYAHKVFGDISMPPENYRRILLIATRQIGDVLLATPLLRTLRRAYPAAVIDVLVYANKGSMLEGNTDCNEVIAVPEHPNRKEYSVLLKRIFRRYDLAVSTQANDRGHLYAFLAASQRVGLMPDLRRQSAWKRWSCRAWALLDNVDTHTVVQNLRLAEQIGIQPHFSLVPPANPAAEALVVAALPSPLPSRLVVLHPFPMWRYKRWTETGWRALIDWCHKEGFFVVITGGPDATERAFCDALADHERCVSIAGRLPLNALPSLLAKAELFIGPDTSVTHLAAACGIPTLAIYGPSNPVKWGPWPIDCSADPSPWQMKAQPWQRRANVLLLQASPPADLDDCVPCREEGCERHKGAASRCLDGLPVATVIAAACELLQPAPVVS